MVTVGIRELKARLSAYIRRAQAGEPVGITDRGTVVAEIRAPSGASAAGARQRYLDAVVAGALRPPTNPSDRSWLDTEETALSAHETARLLDAARGER